ncbi:DUF551 domain-containing protein [Serratia marcescens]|uniref:DUF551 domain-containing protein n=1 Tax=Serratia marcescens TaxID=615 RepID=UPI001FD25858|nr:DUF551 domain-containing protein [Serratia marcescens]
MTLTTTEELKHLASSDNANELTRRLARECLANREAQPVAYAVFADNGNIRIWSTDKGITENVGVPVPLYTAPPAPAVQDGWIPCSEQTPVADGAYWCWFGKEKPSVIQQRVCIWNDRNHEWCDSSVTHWMPLPAAPEGGD